MTAGRPLTVRRVVGAGAVALAAGLAGLAWPVTFQIDGLSMAPGLLPGDLVSSGAFPAIDRFRRPRRFERWVLTAADGTPVIKRVAGLPGETVSVVAGDLAADGVTILKGPRLLAEMGSVVTTVESSDTPTDGTSWQQILPPREVTDDADFAPHERSRPLRAVRDVGLAAEVIVHRVPTGGFVRFRLRVGDFVVACRAAAAGRHALVAGRLDGHLVAAAWPLHAMAAARPGSCLPHPPAATWRAALPWPRRPASDEEPAPHLAVCCEADASSARVERVTVWRDGLYLPAADGTTSWSLGADEFLVLGDFPSGSIDGRRWGPMRRRTLRHRVGP